MEVTGDKAVQIITISEYYCYYVLDSRVGTWMPCLTQPQHELTSIQGNCPQRSGSFGLKLRPLS